MAKAVKRDIEDKTYATNRQDSSRHRSWTKNRDRVHKKNKEWYIYSSDFIQDLNSQIPLNLFQFADIISEPV